MQKLTLHFAGRPGMVSALAMSQALVTEAHVRSGNTDITCSFTNDPDDLSWLPGVDGLITSPDIMARPNFPLRDLAQAAPRLRWIHTISAGIEPLLPLDWMPPGLQLTNNKGVHAAKTREAGIMALLMLNARMPELATQQRHGRWNAIFTARIVGRTVLVIGLGGLGGAVASGARLLGMTVIGVRRQAGISPDADRVIGFNELDEVLPEADFVVLATPLTAQTRLLLDRRRIRLMKQGAGLLNISRPGCLDHPALEDALATGALSGAILDVVEGEPLEPTSRLWSAPNLVITPHVIVDDADLYIPLTLDLVFANAARLQRGEPLVNEVDPARGY